ncbi:hypothetical protein D9M68_822880 [compost metagenome]
MTQRLQQPDTAIKALVTRASEKKSGKRNHDGKQIDDEFGRPPAIVLRPLPHHRIGQLQNIDGPDTGKHKLQRQLGRQANIPRRQRRDRNKPRRRQQPVERRGDFQERPCRHSLPQRPALSGDTSARHASSAVTL